MRKDINKPRGLVWRNSAVPVMEETKYWNNRTKSYDFTFTESKTYFYRNPPFEQDGKGITFKKGHCYSCLKEIKHYSGKCYREVFEYNCWNSEELSEATNLCEDCAKVMAEEVINKGWNPGLSIATRYMVVRNDQWVEHTEYEDGGILDECTSREVPKFAR